MGIPRGLITHWIHQSIGLLEPIALVIRAETLPTIYLYLDETPIRYLVPGSGKVHQGYLWVANVPGGSLFYHWGILARYLEDGRFEIDNNPVENIMRPVKLGAKNPPSPRLRRTGWLFFGSKEAGHHAAVIYTLVENCKRHGVPVEAYLRDLLTRLPTTPDVQTIATLTPASIAAARRRKSDAA